MIIFINEQINLLIGLDAFFIQIVQLFYGSLFLIHLFFYPFGKILGIDIAEEVEFSVAMRV